MPSKLAPWSHETKYGPQPILRLLIGRKLTVTQLVWDVRIPYGRLNAMIHGATPPALVETEKIAAVLGVTHDKLFTDEARYAGGEDL